MQSISVTALLAFAMCIPQLATQTQRVEMGWTGDGGGSETRTQSSDHPLQYYFSTRWKMQFLRAETDNCAVKSMCDENHVEVSQKEIGAPFGKRIVQIVCTTRMSQEDVKENPPRPYWKSIVVETAPGIYREIFRLKNEAGYWAWPPSKAVLIDVGDAKVLTTNDSTTSRDEWCTGAFWVVQESGPVLLDFSAIEAAIKQTLPAGRQAITPICGAVDFQKLEVRVAVQKIGPECRTCGYGDGVIVKFEVEGSRAVPLSVSVSTEKPD